MARFGIVTLRESALGGRGNASGYRDFGVASFSEETVEKPGAGFRVAESGGDAEDLEFGTAEGERHGEGVVNVVANVGIDDDFFGLRRSWSGLCGTRRHTEDDCTK